MNWVRLLLARFSGLFGKSRIERDLQDELQFHFDQEVEYQVSRGLSPEEARAMARKKFGGLEQAKEAYRDTRGLPILENFFRDLSYGTRMLVRNPGFTAVAVVSLGLGIGLNSAVFTFANAALLRGPRVHEPQTLAQIEVTAKGRPGSIHYPAFREISERQSSFEALAAAGGVRLNHAVFRGQDLQEYGRAPIDLAVVTGNYFQLLGVGAELGRLLTDDPTQPETVAVLRYGFWKSALGGAPDAIGSPIILNGVRFTIIGIADESFTGELVGRFRDIWVPMAAQPLLDPPGLLESRTASFFRTYGRLKPGVPASQAAAELTTLYQQILTAERAAGTGSRIVRTAPSDWHAVVSAGPSAFNPARQNLIKPVSILMGVVALVLLIACCNVANLLLARGAARQHEMDARLALGASNGRLAAQLLTESLLLSVLGGLAGFVVAQGGTRLLTFLAEDVVYLTLDLRPDFTVLAFTTAVSLLTTLVFGLVPALQAPRTAGSRTPGLSRRQRTSRALVIAQVALSVWMLTGAGLLLRSLWNLRAADLGLDRAHISTFHLRREPTLQNAELFTMPQEISQRVASLPQARATAFSSFGLFSKGGLTSPVRIPTAAAADRELYVGYVSPGFFTAMGMELSLGRDFAEQDTATGPKVAIVSESVARQYFDGGNPIGQALYLPGIDAQRRYIPFSEGLAEARRYEITGVVRDAFDRGPREEPAYRIYLPLAQESRFADTLYVRSHGDPGSVTPAVLSVLREFAADVSVEEVTTLEQQLNQNYSLEILGARMLTFFGGLALLLATVGLFGVMSYAVNRRTAEIGIRMAIGAPRGRVLTMILRETVLLVAAGITLGLPLALLTTRYLEAMLYGLRPSDPATIATVAAVLLLIGALAGFIPARRASQVDPMTALRHE